ncbi:hypothetical protein C9I57_11125 [Trinickia symbiotica]|uniref:DUF1493 domain-containing protein n=1 Tax=Trinickia symbiotica TaxID=863227 RepID=A0A2T3XV79_9BURK|nr:DUF1493 family protein [Trinickia symbiotica]PTB20426.1 hypothetical protein C9I57_11125 [Trinickia symbiotica]
MSDPLLEEVESFVRSERGLPHSDVITPATTLEDDLGITGIEGEMFMDAFFAHFKVDEGDFSSGRYFMDEGSGLLLMLVTALSRKRRKALNRVPLTVSMLVTAARLGRWDSEKVEKGRQ